MINRERFEPLTATERAKLAYWAGLPLFRELSTDDLEALYSALRRVYFKPGEELIRQGESGDVLYLVVSGTLRVWTQDGGLDRLLQAPQTLGEMALMTQEPRTANVRALSEVEAYQMERACFQKIVAAHPQTARILTHLVGQRLREIDGIRQVGPYRILSTLSLGGESDVFLAYHPQLERQVALKMLPHAQVYHPNFRTRFDREARMIAALEHNHIVRVYDYVQAYGTQFIVMERLEGQVLERVIEEGHSFTWGQLRRLLAQIADALALAHSRGLVHRDVKPLNIFLGSDGNARLLDFGIAIPIEDSQCSGAERLGTPDYMAPEQITGSSLDGRTDLYALGLVAYELITGRVAFDAPDTEGLVHQHLFEPVPDVRRYRPNCPSDLVGFIARCCAKRPEDRFEGAREAYAWLTGASAVEAFEHFTLGLHVPVSARKRFQAELDRFTQRVQAFGVELDLQKCGEDSGCHREDSA